MITHCISVNVYDNSTMNRPKLPKNLRRVVISARILPETKKALAKWSKASGKSVGEIIDSIVRQSV